MSASANPARGEIALELDSGQHVLRPTFAALVAAEDEVGPLFAMVERASEGRLTLSELAALFWHCLRDRPEETERAVFAESIAATGLTALTPALKALIRQILLGR